MKPDLLAMAEAAESLKEANGGHWGEHPAHPVDDWESEVRHGNTRQGYWEWVAALIENDGA